MLIRCEESSLSLVGECQAAIRPEHIRLEQPTAAPSANSLVGVITSVIVLGETLQYVVECAQSRRELLVRTPRHGNATRTEGEPCSATWEARSVRIYPASEQR